MLAYFPNDFRGGVVDLLLDTGSSGHATNSQNDFLPGTFIDQVDSGIGAGGATNILGYGTVRWPILEEKATVFVLSEPQLSFCPEPCPWVALAECDFSFQ